MYRRSAPVNPRWIVARYAEACHHCGQLITIGDEAFYYPRERRVLCAGEDCGRSADRALAADDFDQAVYQSQYPQY